MVPLELQPKKLVLNFRLDTKAEKIPENSSWRQMRSSIKIDKILVRMLNTLEKTDKKYRF